jgi:hypothetical protein
MVTPPDVLRGQMEQRGAVGREILACPECGALVRDDHLDWCSLYEDDGEPDEGSGATSGNTGSS